MFKLARGIELPSTAVTQTFGFLGRRGSGKTYAAGVFAEELLEQGVQTVIFDPLGNWHGLRATASGKGTGYPVPIFGGEHGDLPLNEHSGKLVADLIVDERVSAILDVSPFSKRKRQQFVAEFAEQLFQRKKTARSPIHLIIEEAHLFAPQRTTDINMRMLGAIEDIVRLGRNFGIGASLIDQRPQSVNKEVLNQIECLLVFQLNAAHERKAIREWIVFQGEDISDTVDQLPSLQTGECYLWSPQWLDLLKRIKIRKKRTYDSSGTPEIGFEEKAEARTLAAIDVPAIEKRMEGLIEELKQNDPRELRRKVAELERELRERPPGVDQEQVADMIKEAVGAAIEDRDDQWRDILSQLEKHFEQIRELCDVEPVAPPPTPDSPRTFLLNERHTTHVPNRRTRRQHNDQSIGNTDGELGKTELNVLKALFWLENETANQTKVAFYAGYSASASTVGVAMSKLRKMGYAEGWRITPLGRAAVPNSVEPKPTGAELREWFRPKVGGTENRVLDVLMDVYPNRMTNDELAEAAGYSPTASTVGVALSKLRKLEAVEGQSRDGGVRAADILFARA